MLIDRELPDEERERIIAVIEEHHEVLGVHDRYTRRVFGRKRFARLCFALDGGITLYRTHGIADTVEAELETLFSGTGGTIHEGRCIAPDETPNLSLKPLEAAQVVQSAGCDRIGIHCLCD